MFIDTHAHPLHSKFTEQAPLGIAEYLAQAQAAGVGQVLGVACRRTEWVPMLAACAQYPNLKAIAGVHPHDADEHITAAELAELAANPYVVAFGETGLDNHYPDIASAADQEASFHRHLEAAHQHNLPVVVHTRDAEERTIGILREHPGVPFVLHCFSGSPWLADEGLALGGYLSFSGIMTFGKSAQTLCNIAAHAPRSRVLIETDAPYLAPAPHRGQRNTSALLPHTAHVLANLWQMGMPELGALTTANAQRLFTRLA
jgi:TatD DNase family protein